MIFRKKWSCRRLKCFSNKALKIFVAYNFAFYQANDLLYFTSFAIQFKKAGLPSDTGRLTMQGHS